MRTAEQRRDWRRRSGSPAGRGNGAARPWTSDEDREVLAQRVPDRVLAERLDRSVQAIHTHRCKLKGGYR